MRFGLETFRVSEITFIGNLPLRPMAVAKRVIFRVQYEQLLLAHHFLEIFAPLRAPVHKLFSQVP